MSSHVLTGTIHELFERAKSDYADLLSEIQSIDPTIFVAMDGGVGALSLLALKVVYWLQVSPVFMSTGSQIIQSNLTTILQPIPRNAVIHHMEQSHFGTAVLITDGKFDRNEGNLDDSNEDEDDSNSRYL